MALESRLRFDMPRMATDVGKFEIMSWRKRRGGGDPEITDTQTNWTEEKGQARMDEGSRKTVVGDASIRWTEDRLGSN